MTARVWAEIDIAAIRENLAAIRMYLGSQTDVMAVVKANAYGHGLEIVSRAAWDTGTRWFGVATVSEGVTLRALLPQSRICLFAPFLHGDEAEIVNSALIPMLSNLDQAKRIAAESVRGREPREVHLEIDIGMGRSGALVEDALELATSISALPALRLTGAATHFPRADSDSSLTVDQIQRFAALIESLRVAGIRIETVHAANSGAALLNPESHFNLARPGLLMYGIRPDTLIQTETPTLKPALTLKTRVALLRDLPAGHSISYGGEHTLSRPSRVATLPVGYGDGFPRGLSNLGFVLIRGRRAPILGRVCMDMTMVDVTDIVEAKEGDVAVLIGNQGDEWITVEDIATMIVTTEHDVTTRLTDRVARIPINVY